MLFSMIRNIILDKKNLIGLNEIVENERKIAICDLLAENDFKPLDHKQEHIRAEGGYHLYLSIKEAHLIIDIRSENEDSLAIHKLSLKAFRAIIKDYFMICESYYAAVKQMNPSRVEAIDMGRRGIHDEGAALLSKCLRDKVEMDYNTSRRLFTLICVLHIRRL